MDDHKPEAGRRDAIDSDVPDLYGELKSVPVTVEAISFEEKRIETEHRPFERTFVRVHGDGATGFSEDVTRPIKQ